MNLKIVLTILGAALTVAKIYEEQENEKKKEVKEKETTIKTISI